MCRGGQQHLKLKASERVCPPLLPQVCDFSMARVLGSAAGRDPRWLAPEVLAGGADSSAAVSGSSMHAACTAVLSRPGRQR